ncbi:hypothetical protein [Brucella anthropi]|uniref:hypothetical protein n=1 Tax=Brucella anthropi TaxID=529 RepID=UPI00124C1571|nr:hypothetical protein [Brucella anthropi]KAB2751823.1 hypothetical protein F9L05_01425 [Brucella anthropi]
MKKSKGLDKIAIFLRLEEDVLATRYEFGLPVVIWFYVFQGDRIHPSEFVMISKLYVRIGGLQQW